MTSSQRTARYEWAAEPDAAASLRRYFREFNKLMVWMWRLGLGRWSSVWPSVAGRIFVVEHCGRRSGNRYLTPLNYTSVDDSVYCLAAFGDKTDWYRNVQAGGRAALWLPDGKWEAEVADGELEANRLELVRQVLIDSGFAAPAFGLHPREMSDDALAEATSQYRLVRFDLTRKYEQGPADKAWIWVPVGASILAIAAWRLCRRFDRAV